MSLLTQGDLDMIKEQLKNDLQVLVQQASEIRKQRDGAKTNVKRKYFDRKLSKINEEVIKRVATMQKIADREQVIGQASKNEQQ